MLKFLILTAFFLTGRTAADDSTNISGVSSPATAAPPPSPHAASQASQARCDPRADTDTSTDLDADENKGAAESWRTPPTSGGLIETQKCGGVSQKDGGRSQICCLAQDQSQDKVINLKQDVRPLTVFFIFFGGGGQRGSKNPNRCRRNLGFWD